MKKYYKKLKIWDKIKSLIKKELNSKLVYNDKTNIYSDKVYTMLQHNKIPKDNEFVHVYL